jgi:hypothetical protein
MMPRGPLLTSKLFGPVSGELLNQLALPFVMMLLLIAGIHSAQECFVFFKGAHSWQNFALFFIADIIYYLYFLLVPVVIGWLGTAVPYTGTPLPLWAAIHIFTSVLILCLHQVLSLGTDMLVLSGKRNVSFSDRLLINPLLWFDLAGYFILLLYFRLAEHRDRLHSGEIKNSQLEVELVKHTLTELQNKLHPKFFFNSLEAIRRKLKVGRNREAYEVLSGFSDFLRKLIYENEAERTNLRQEIQFLSTYIALETRNFDNDIHLSVEMELEAEECIVPAGILHLLAEECLYSVIDHSQPSVDIKVAVSHAALLFNILITVQPVQAESTELELDAVFSVVRQKLKQFYKDGAQCKVSCEHDSKISIRLAFPGLVMNENMHGLIQSEIL